MSLKSARIIHFPNQAGQIRLNKLPSIIYKQLSRIAPYPEYNTTRPFTDTEYTLHIARVYLGNSLNSGIMIANEIYHAKLYNEHAHCSTSNSSLKTIRYVACPKSVQLMLY